MNIRFTKHAKFRCMQRKIPQSWVSELIKDIPYYEGIYNRIKIDGTNLIVVYQDRNGVRNIVTLHAGTRKK